MHEIPSFSPSSPSTISPDPQRPNALPTVGIIEKELSSGLLTEVLTFQTGKKDNSRERRHNNLVAKYRIFRHMHIFLQKNLHMSKIIRTFAPKLDYYAKFGTNIL